MLQMITICEFWKALFNKAFQSIALEKYNLLKEVSCLMCGSYLRALLHSGWHLGMALL